MTVLEMAKAIEDHCSKTTNCSKCELFNGTEKNGFCMVEGLSPWEWELGELVHSSEQKEGNVSDKP